MKNPVSTLNYLQKCVKSRKDPRKAAVYAFSKLQTISSTEEIAFITKDEKCLDFKKYASYCGIDGRKARHIIEYVDINQQVIKMEGLSYLLKQGYSEEFNKVIIELLNEYAQKLLTAMSEEVEFENKVSAEHIEGTTFFIEL